MLTNNRYLPFALVALVSSALGWGASTLTSKETTSAMPVAQLSAQPNALQPVSPQPITMRAFAPVTVPEATNALTSQQPAQVVVVKEAPAPVVRTVPVRTRATTQPATTVDEDNREVLTRTTTRKRGMSNKAKTAIAIGGAAGLGAAIGGLSGGGKGAAIGALIGAGSGTVYSVIRHKQRKPVF
jgi:hypothetical protein